MPHPGRNNIYDAAIRRMVNEALDTQEQQFSSLHEGDSDGQLLAYLRWCAKRLGHTPWPREIPGGILLEERFGSWENACLLARLPKPDTPDKLACFIRYQEEVERQKEVYRQKKAEKKLRAQQRLQEQQRKQKERE